MTATKCWRENRKARLGRVIRELSIADEMRLDYNCETFNSSGLELFINDIGITHSTGSRGTFDGPSHRSLKWEEKEC